MPESVCPVRLEPETTGQEELSSRVARLKAKPSANGNGRPVVGSRRTSRWRLLEGGASVGQQFILRLDDPRHHEEPGKGYEPHEEQHVQ
jgi:hypothetical protein